MDKIIRENLIQLCVENLKEYGYKTVTYENIITDPVFSLFFKRILEEQKGSDSEVDLEIEDLIKEIQK